MFAQTMTHTALAVMLVASVSAHTGGPTAGDDSYRSNTQLWVRYEPTAPESEAQVTQREAPLPSTEDALPLEVVVRLLASGTLLLSSVVGLRAYLERA